MLCIVRHFFLSTEHNYKLKKGNNDHQILCFNKKKKVFSQNKCMNNANNLDFKAIQLINEEKFHSIGRIFIS